MSVITWEVMVLIRSGNDTITNSWVAPSASTQTQSTPVGFTLGQGLSPPRRWRSHPVGPLRAAPFRTPKGKLGIPGKFLGCDQHSTLDSPGGNRYPYQPLYPVGRGTPYGCSKSTSFLESPGRRCPGPQSIFHHHPSQSMDYRITPLQSISTIISLPLSTTRPR